MNRARTLYIVTCAAGPAADVAALVDLAHHRGWDCHLIATPSACTFIDVDTLQRRTGNPVRHRHREPDQPRHRRPAANAVIIAPATANTVAKLAAGIADNYALDTVNECIGAGVPVVVLPFVNAALANRAPLQRAITALGTEGIHVLHRTPHPAGAGSQHQFDFPWQQALDTAEAKL